MRNISSFPDLIKSTSSNANCENISYDLEGYFTREPVQETFGYIFYKNIYQERAETILRKNFFTKLLSKLTKECVFSLYIKG